MIGFQIRGQDIKKAGTWKSETDLKVMLPLLMTTIDNTTQRAPRTLEMARTEFLAENPAWRQELDLLTLQWFEVCCRWKTTKVEVEEKLQEGEIMNAAISVEEFLSYRYESAWRNWKRMISSRYVRPRRADFDPAINRFSVMNRIPSYGHSSFNEHMRGWIETGKNQCDQLVALWFPTIFSEQKDHKDILSARPFYLGGKALALIEVSLDLLQRQLVQQNSPLC